eukprot:TRINITY_DN21665_c0_g1_i1.p1 TRINITY_DN21665_c0_g1~~TRINITY_DN21665_c0_g1_i1.p1  ORF type:complete len:721 (+),score=135.23 TRINITY_DN21665_c0_g1_i1:82-2244(+)
MERAAFATVADAAQAQNAEAVMDMLKQGQSVNAQDAQGNTALHWAAWFKADSLVHQLMESGARADIGNTSGESPVHWAAKSSNVFALDAMTRSDRARLSQRDSDGFTPFIISSQNDNSQIMEWMYLKGVSVEERDDWGRTALQWACYKGHRKTVQWLLSRHASIAHRDLEGMTAVHWAALKGHVQVAEMLLEVGAVHLLDVPDACGDTPIALAMRKRNRYLVICFHKCQVLQFLIGRPNLSRNNFANLFVCFIAFNIAVFAFIIAPGIVNSHPWLVVWWALVMAGSLMLWIQNCFADPGWLQSQTIYAQDRLIGPDPWQAFDASQPVESQMLHYDRIGQELADSEQADVQFGQLEQLELEQVKFNYQRQLITEARKRNFTDGMCAFSSAANPVSGAECQPLIGTNGSGPEGSASHMARQDQLETALVTLQERELATAESLGRARMARLMDQGCGEYLQLVEKGDFKQVCVVCRARRKMRSHHCKECGRCVDRLDHHCPWIDNCVGLGNQRSFFLFILALLATIMGLYWGVILYAFDSLFPAIGSGSFSDFIDDVTSGTFGPMLRPLIVVLTAAFDVIWLAFVGALVCRQTGYMMTNVTTFEVLVRPAHVQRRFPKIKGRFWFLHGFGVFSGMRHCWNYWTLNTEQDASDFSGVSAQDSFPMPPRDRSRQGDGSRARRGNSYEKNQPAADVSVSSSSTNVTPDNAPAYTYGGPPSPGHGGA